MSNPSRPLLGVIGGSGLYDMASLQDVEQRSVETPWGLPSDDVVIGTFNQLATPLLCQGDGSGGMIFGVVVGLDSTLYKTNDQLLSLNGAEVELRVTITDALGATATVTQPIVLVVGN